ncbi:MAG: S41 family peptidase [Tissierellales bacterium]|jgi:hypothetical protein|nr:S41 family peptidase [Tissierellales bacterium]
MKKLITGALVTLMVLTGSMQSLAAAGEFENFEYVSDLKVLKDLLNENHGNLYEHISEKELNEAFENAYNAVDEDMTYPEFYEELAKIVSKIKDGHTSLSAAEWFKSQVNENGMYLPLTIKKIEGKYVSDFVYDAIPLGAEIVSINGDDIEDIVSRLKTSTANETDDDAGLSQHLVEFLFPQLYTIYYGEAEENTVVYNDLDGNEQSVVLTSEDASLNELVTYKYSNYMTGKYGTSMQSIDAEFIEEKRVGILRIYTFSPADSEYFTSCVDHFFREMKTRGYENLIFDVRGNLGGDSEIMDHILSYVIDEPMKSVDRIELYKLPTLSGLNMVSSEQDYSYLTGMVESVMNDERPFDEQRADGAYRKADGTFVFEEEPIEPAKQNSFSGKIFAIADGGSFSCGTIFPQMIKKLENGTLVGLTPGGNYYDTTAGIMLDWTLPNTKTSITIPLVQLITESEKIEGISENSGVEPDIKVEQTLEDFLNKEDTQLNSILESL